MSRGYQLNFRIDNRALTEHSCLAPTAIKSACLIIQFQDSLVLSRLQNYLFRGLMLHVMVGFAVMLGVVLFGVWGHGRSGIRHCGISFGISRIAFCDTFGTRVTG